MYGNSCYGEVPFAAFASVILFVAACITTGDNLAFTVNVEDQLVTVTVNVEDQLVTVAEVSIHSC